MRSLATPLIVFALMIVTAGLVDFVDRSSDPGPVELLAENEIRHDAPFKPAGSDDAQAPHSWDGGPEDEDLASRRSWELMRLADPRTGRIPPDIHRREREFVRDLPQRRESALLEAAGPTRVNLAASWRSRGPWNVGGRTRALAIDVSDPSYQTVLAGGASGGMWRSTDDGLSWTLQTGSSQLHSVTCIAQDVRAGHENVWYYGTGEWRGGTTLEATYLGDGIFKSVDGGQTWALLPSTSGAPPNRLSNDFQLVHRLAIDPSNLVEDEVYAATYGRIMRSVDGGDTFVPVLGQSDAVSSLWTEVVVSSSGVVYATKSSTSSGAIQGIYRSPDGLAWTEITPSWAPRFRRVVLALAPADQNILYCMLEAEPNSRDDVRLYKYTYVSGDGSGAGGIWEDRSLEMRRLPVATTTTVVDTQSNYNMLLAIHPSSPDIVYLGARHLWRSTDGFATADHITHIGGAGSDYRQWDMHSLVFRPGSGAVAYTGSDVGVHKTLDALAPAPVWENLNHGYNTTQHYTVYLDEDAPGNPVLTGGMQDNGSWATFSTLSDVDWIDHTGADGGYGGIYDTTEAVGTYFYSWQNGPIVRLKVDNQTGAWISGTQCHPTDAGDFLFINPYMLDPLDHRIIYMATSRGIWRNNDHTAIPEYTGGPVMTNWEHLTTEPRGQYISALDVSRGAARVLYYGTADGTVWKLENATTAPAGSAPSRLVNIPEIMGSYVSGIAIHPDDEQEVLLSCSNYEAVSLFHTIYGGASWQAVEGNLGGEGGPAVFDVAIFPNPDGGGDIYFAATSTGLYSTSELAGPNTIWHLEAPDSIGNALVHRLATRPADGTIAAATYGKGIYSIFTGLSTAVDETPQTGRTVLAQNYPNPFNPQTTIHYEISASGQIDLTVFDVAGRRVKTLASGFVEAGQHDAQWDGRDEAGERVASGVYLYRLRAGDHVETKRMVMVK
jgi:hypothetical protein